MLVETDDLFLYFLAPVGGTKITLNERVVRLVSPQSPIGQTMLGMQVDDEGLFESPSGPQPLALIEVS